MCCVQAATVAVHVSLYTFKCKSAFEWCRSTIAQEYSRTYLWKAPAAPRAERQRLWNLLGLKTFIVLFRHLVEYGRLGCLFLHSSGLIFLSRGGWLSLKDTSRAGGRIRRCTFTLSLTLMPVIYIIGSVKLTWSTKHLLLQRKPRFDSPRSIWSVGCAFLAGLFISAKNLPHEHTTALDFSHISEVCIIFRLRRLFSRSHLDLI